MSTLFQALRGVKNLKYKIKNKPGDNLENFFTFY